MAGAENVGIEDAVGKELATMDVRGTLVLAGTSLELHPAEGGAPVSIEIEQIVGQWPLLPPEMQKRKAVEVAQRLAGAHRFSRRVESKPKAPALDASWGRVLGAVLALFGALGAVGLFRYAVPRLAGDPAPEPSARGESETARKDRVARACEAARSRLLSGASFGPFMAEGWAVELWLARRGGPLAGDPALTALVGDGARLAPSADAELAAIPGGTLEIVDGLGDGGSPGWGAATLVFRDGYATAFFEEARRARFLELGERVASALGADHAAFYARCDHLATHDVGAWFHGQDMAGATVALVYEMELFAGTRRVDRKALGPKGDLDTLRKAAGDLGDAPARSLVGAEGASVTTTHGVTFVFPFAAPTRSRKAADALSRRMGIAVTGGE